MTQSLLRHSCAIALWLCAACGAKTEEPEEPASCRQDGRQACTCEDGRRGTRECTAKPADAACECSRPARAGGAGDAGRSSRGDGPDAGANAGSEARGGADAAAGSGGRRAPATGGAGDPAESAAAGDSGSPAASDAGEPIDPIDPIDAGAVSAEPDDAASFLFDQSQLRTYNLVIDPNDLAIIDASPAAEQWVPASLEFEGQTHGPYMVRYKGGAGGFMYPCTSGPPGGPQTGKCSLKLGFDEVDKAARFHGLRKLNFHSMQADGSMLRERLGYSLFRAMGVAAPRAAHARVLINGELEGLFALVEQVDGRFTRARFSEGGEGNVYKEVWPSYSDAETYLAALETNEDEQPSVQRMLDLQAAIATGADAAGEFFDRDYLMDFLAVDRVIINDDGIFRFWCDHTAMGNNRGAAGNHNYYWYEARDAARLWLVPWDLDKSFAATLEVHLDPAWNVAGTCACNSHPEYGIQFPAACDPLIQHFASWQTEFDDAVDAFIAGPFARDEVDAKLDAWIEQIRPTVVESAGILSAPDEATWSEAVTDLREKIDAARANRGFAY